MKKTLNILCFILSLSNNVFAQKLLETPFNKMHWQKQELLALNKVKTIYEYVKIKTLKGIRIDTVEIHRFNKKGKLIEEENYRSGRLRRSVIKYDSLGRKIREAMYEEDSNWPFNGVDYWEYNTKENLIETHSTNGYKTVIPRSKPNEEHYFEDDTLKRVTKLFVNKTGSIYTTVEHDETKTLIDSTIYEVNSGQLLLKYTSDLNSESPYVFRYKYDKYNREIERISVIEWAVGGGFNIKIEYNNKDLPVAYREYTLDGSRLLRTLFRSYEYYE